MLPTLPGTRPTSGRVREALMNIWQDRLTGASFLDLFAGTGAVGLEALSRGAKRVVLMEKASDSLRSLRQAADVFKIDSCDVQVVAADLPGDLDSLKTTWARNFDLVFVDPPYDFADHAGVLSGVAPLLRPGAEVAIEHRRSSAPTISVLDWHLAQTRSYGDSCLSFFRFRQARRKNANSSR